MYIGYFTIENRDLLVREFIKDFYFFFCNNTGLHVGRVTFTSLIPTLLLHCFIFIYKDGINIHMQICIIDELN